MGALWFNCGRLIYWTCVAGLPERRAARVTGVVAVGLVMSAMVWLLAPHV